MIWPLFRAWKVYVYTDLMFAVLESHCILRTLPSYAMLLTFRLKLLAAMFLKSYTKLFIPTRNIGNGATIVCRETIIHALWLFGRLYGSERRTSHEVNVLLFF